MFMTRLTALCLLITLHISPSMAQDAQIAGDIEYGEYLSSECAGCHQINGSSSEIPPIVGWDPESFVAVMNSYRNKEREHQAMQLIAGRLDDEMIASLAIYFGSLPVPE